ncbi:hypothetical protein PCASD_00108 [Puccinia coronata f. sp. avenae]|uniref:hAT-like transposase RNase-H fold domain-containing protein n=1 Tax=Puccinia coronata f. sp. avenae TaxID=200324 RepID=A0A2N5VR31_9BASI|nr:hypothetical protein PCASD_00108 [Puccinia coronata f. sp. avenae]
MYKSMKEKIANEIASVDRIALMTDLWTSSNQTPFMVVSAHFISSDWKLHKRIISFKELPPPHTGLAISNQLVASIVEWKVMDKVSHVTVDNASSNDVALARLAQILKDKSRLPPDLNGKFFHVRCAAHIINLIVKDGLKELSTAVSKIRDSVWHVKSTPARKKQFQDAIKETNIPTQALPSVDVPTRWNSTYIMLKSVLPFKQAFINLSERDANYLNCPTDEEWNEISMMKDFLEVFNIATLKLGTTRSPSAHMLYMNMNQINRQLKQSIESGPPYISSLIKPMQEKYNKYWKKMELFAGITFAFDTRYKLALLEFLLLDKLGSDKNAIATCVNKIRDGICELFDKISSRHNKNTEKTSLPGSQLQPKKNVLESNQEMQFNEFLAGKNTEKSSWGTGELDLYLEESTVPIDTKGFDILDWWRINSL